MPMTLNNLSLLHKFDLIVIDNDFTRYRIKQARIFWGGCGGGGGVRTPPEIFGTPPEVFSTPSKGFCTPLIVSKFTIIYTI